MKIFTIIISLLLLSYINSSECTDKKSPSKDTDCKDLKVSTGNKYCCYYKVSGKDDDGKKDTFNYCLELSEDNYNKIKDYIKDIEKAGEDYDIDVKKLDCYSVYLTGSLLSLILLLL